MVFPKGTTFGQWFPVLEGKDWRIKRMATPPSGKRKPERLSRKTYKHVSNTYEAMLKHCDRLNFGVNMAKQREIEIITAFIPPSLLTGFQNELYAAIPSKQYAAYLYNKALQEYFLDFFITHLKLPDPKLWAANQVKWGLALTSKEGYKVFDSPASARTIKLVIQTANRFLRYLHEQLPSTYPLIRLAPVSNAVLKLYESNRPKEEEGKYIKDADWVTINKKLPKDIKPFIQLMYFYGLRRSESLGFESPFAVKKAYLHVTHQLDSVGQGPKYEPLKDREQRKTPHWYCTAKEAHRLISESSHKMHPDTLSEKWEDLMINLEMDYQLHDFRRTFITRALRDHNSRDVQMAVGHSDLRTTMKYAQDDRSLADEAWTPDAS